MTLNSSGPISLGGSTTGQSINLELGQSATAQVSLNDANVRSLAGVPSGVIVMPVDFWGKSSAVYFAASAYNPCVAYYGFAYRVNSDKSITVFKGNGNLLAFTFNSSGTLTTQQIGTHTDVFGPTPIAFDTSGNLYFTSNSNADYGTGLLLIYKVSTSNVLTVSSYTFPTGGLVWQILGVASGTVDSSGYLNIPIYRYDGSVSFNSYVYRTNTSLAGVNYFNVSGLTVRAQMAQNSTSTTGRVLTRVQISSACLQYYQTVYVNAIDKNWYLQLPFQNVNAGYMVQSQVDSSGNVYVMYGAEYPANEVHLYKYDTNGNAVWGKKYTGLGGGFSNAGELVIDSLGNIYVTYLDWDYYACFVLKVSASSGAVQWANSIGYYVGCCYNSAYIFNLQISPYDTSSYYAVLNSTTGPGIIKLPANGTGLGSYSLTGVGPFDYTSASVTTTTVSPSGTGSATYTITPTSFSTTAQSDSLSTTSGYTGYVQII